MKAATKTIAMVALWLTAAASAYGLLYGLFVVWNDLGNQDWDKFFEHGVLTALTAGAFVGSAKAFKWLEKQDWDSN